MKKNVLESFQKLMKGDQKNVIKSVLGILKHLSESEEDELNYSLTRLIRGLGGSRTKVQSNYFITLIAILNSTNKINVGNLFDIINKALQASSSNAKGENADIYNGQILVCGAIIHSPLFERLSRDDQIKVLTMIHEAGKQRSYLKLEASIFLVDVIQKVTEQEYKDLVHPIIKESILKDLSKHDQDSLYLLISAADKFPGQFKKKFLTQFIGTSSIICQESIKLVADMLMNTSSIKSVKHPVYDAVLKKVSKTCLEPFLEEFDATLQKPNYNRHLTAAHVLHTILLSLDDGASIHLLFTKNFMVQTMHYFKTKKANDDLGTYLQKLFRSLVEVVKTKAIPADDVMQILRKLTFWPGEITFDQITKLNTVNDIITNMNADGIKKLIEMYKNILFLKEEKDGSDDTSSKWLNSERLYVANALTRILRHPSITDDLDFRRDQINSMMTVSLFRTAGFSLELANSLKKVFYSSLDQKFSKLEHLCSVLSHVIQSLEANLTDGKQLLQPLQDETKELLSNTLAVIRKLEKKKTKKLNQVFYTMFLLMALQLFQQPKMASDCLNELFMCYDRVKDKKKHDAHAETDGDVVKKEPAWIEVVVDLFLNLLSQNSHLLRNMIGSVFPHLCEHLTPSAVRQILEILDPRNNSNPLMDYDIDDDEAVEDADEDLQVDDDSSGDEAFDEDYDEDNTAEEETVNDKLRMALQQALSRGKETEADDESVNLDEMSESEGAELDKALASVFRQYKPNRRRSNKKQPREENALTHFRLRALDLIRIYVGANPSMAVAVEIVIPLLHLVEFSVRETHQLPLRVPLAKCLERMAQLKKFADVDGVNETTLIELTRSLFDKGTRNANVIKDMDAEYSNACTFVLRCTQFYQGVADVPKEAKKKLKEIRGILAGELNDFFAKRDALTPYVLWKNVLCFEYGVASKLTNVLVENAFNVDVKLFKRSQALKLLVVLYVNKRFLTAIKDAKREKLVAEFVAKTIAFLEDLRTNTKDCATNESFVANLFGCIAVVKKSSALQNAIGADDFAKIGTLIREIRAKTVMSANCLNQYKTLCTLLNVKHLVKATGDAIRLKKEDVAEEKAINGNDATEKVAKKKRKKIKDEEQNRKKRKIERVKSLSEGFLAL